MKIFRKLIINLVNIADGLIPEKISRKYESSSKLTIYNLHSTSEEFFLKYKSLLTKLKNEGTFINPANIDDFINNKLPNKSLFLLTIDDGFKNNLNFAKKVLKPLNIKAIFFVIPKFIKNTNKEINYEYYESLYPEIKYRLNRKNHNQFIPLSKENINEIKDLGHTIGMHGLEHENYFNLSEEKIKNNIKKGVKIFSDLDINIKHFAYPFGNEKSFNNESNIIIGNHFKYIHSGLRGFNYPRKNKTKFNFLMRHPISTHDKDLIYYPTNFKEIKFFTLNKITSLFYSIKRKIKKKSIAAIEC